MGRRRRVHDDLGELALERLRDVLTQTAPDARVAREMLREERRRRREEESRRTFLAVGVALLVGGLAMAALPTVAAVGLAFLAGGITVYLIKAMGGVGALMDRGLAARPVRAPIQPPALAASVPEARREVVRKVLEEATGELRRLDAARARLADPGAAAIVERLVLVGQRLTAAIAASPERLAEAQRLLTYHLPKAAFVAELLASLGEGPGDLTRAQDARLVLARMDNLFEKTELDLRSGDGREMDLELRLINQALDEDLGAERRA